MKQGFTISLDNTTLALKGVPPQDIFISTEGFSDLIKRNQTDNSPESKVIDIQISLHVRGEKKEEKSTLNNREEKQNRLAGSLYTTDSNKCSQTFNSNIWYGSTHKEEEVRDRKESLFTYTLSSLASYWRASNWRPSGAEPAILFFQQLHKRKKKRFEKPSDLQAAALYYYFPPSTTVTRAH
jgi:hypothetical protein